MPFTAIREVIRVQAKTELGKGEAALWRVFTECVILSRAREATVEITVNGIEMHILSSALHWSEDPRKEAGRWQTEYLTKLTREMERRLPPCSTIYITPPSPEGPPQA